MTGNVAQGYSSGISDFSKSFGITEAMVPEEYVMGGLETGAKCGVGERPKTFTRGYPAPAGSKFIRAGISNEYEGRATATVRAGGEAVDVTSYAEPGQEAKYRWYGVYVKV